MSKEKYRIIYRNTYYGDEEIDTAENKKEALTLVSEYRIAFKSNNISYQKI
jgi:hypothetical protein